MLFVFAVALVIIGLLKHQPRLYWIHAAGAVAFMWAFLLLFSGGGTLEDPTGDGMITHLIRRASNDGPILGLLAIPILVLGWGIPIWIARRGYEAVKPAPPTNGPG